MLQHIVLSDTRSVQLLLCINMTVFMKFFWQVKQTAGQGALGSRNTPARMEARDSTNHRRNLI